MKRTTHVTFGSTLSIKETLTSSSLVPSGEKAGWLRCILTVPPGSFEIVEDGGTTIRDTHQIILKMLKTNLRLREEDFETEPKCRVMDVEKHRHLMQSWQNRQHLRSACYIRLQFFKATEHNLLVRYVDQIPDLLRGRLVEPVEEALKRFFVDNNRLLDEEHKEAEKQLLQHNRANVIVVSRRFEGAPVFDLVSQGGQWNIPNGQTVSISGDRLFRFVDAPRYKDRTGWIALVQYRQNKAARHIVTVKLINSKVNLEVQRQLNVDGQEITTVTVHAFDDDKQHEEHQKALRIAEHMFDLEYGKEILEFSARSKCFVKMAHLFVNHPSNHANNWDPDSFQLRSGGSTLDFSGFSLKPAMERAMYLFVEGRGGAAGIIGPPGTGKTTFIGTLVVLFLQQVKLRHNRIMLSAHSSQATIECLAKTAAAMKKAGIMSDDGSLLHIESKSSREKRFGENPDLKNGPLERYSLSATMHRIAQSNSRFVAFVKGAEVLKKSTRIEDRALSKAYNRAKFIIWRMLRTRAKVICCTLGGLLNPFFLPSLQDQYEGRFEVDMLVIDEASQAMLPPILMAVEILNPRRVGFCGDDKQLPAHYKTQFGAKMMGERSTLKRLEDRGMELPMLDYEFRMPYFLYKPNSIMFYGGKVKGGPGVDQRRESIELRKHLERIEFSPDGVTFFKLSHPGLIFNITYGQMMKESDEEASENNPEEVKSLSRYNVAEADFVKLLATALYEADVPQNYIMALTGDQAQWDLLEEINSKAIDPGNFMVRKVKGCQGAEAMVVILSTCITDPFEVGFMSCKQRLNVLTSSQKEALFHVCHLKTLQTRVDTLGGKMKTKYKDAIRPWVDYYKLFIEAQQEVTKARFVFDVQRNHVFRVKGKIVKALDKMKLVDATPVPALGPAAWSQLATSGQTSPTTTISASGPAAQTVVIRPPPVSSSSSSVTLAPADPVPASCKLQSLVTEVDKARQYQREYEQSLSSLPDHGQKLLRDILAGVKDKSLPKLLRDVLAGVKDKSLPSDTVQGLARYAELDSRVEELKKESEEECSGGIDDVVGGV